MVRKAFIVGTGGHAQMFYQLLCSSKESYSIQAWLETENYEGPDQLFDRPIIRQTQSGLSFLKTEEIHDFYFGIGMVKAAPWRMAIYQELLAQGFIAQSFIHSSAIVDASCSIAPGTFIGAGCILQPDVKIGQNCILNTGTIVEHHSNIADNVHLAPGVILCGQTQIGAHTMLGAGSIVLQGLSIENNATLAAGSVVTQNVAANTTMIGRPAKPKISNKEHE
jgi:sugar O-acyltransferase (sialic acid O-acetyltransferase NeuD family)